MSVVVNWFKTDIRLWDDYPQDLDWTLLTQLAVLVRKTRDAKDGFTCKLSDDWSTGNSWFVRRLEFSDGCIWILRAAAAFYNPENVQREVDTMSLIRQKTNVPIPQIFAHMRRDDPNNPISTDWMLMEFIPGNTVDDEWGGRPVHKGIYPPLKYVPKLYSGLAGHVAEICSLRFSKIGAVHFKNNRFEIGPIPGWGGPWDTAGEFFAAIADRYSHIYSKGHRDQVREESRERTIRSYHYFLPRLAEIARETPFREGPFPLIHRDLSSHNIVVDPDCNILGILDWHMAQTIPWEVAEFCDEMASRFNELLGGQPDPNHGNQELYAKTDFHKLLRQAEEDRNLGHEVSMAQATQRFRTLAYAFHYRITHCVEGDYDEVLKLFGDENQACLD